MHHAEHFLSRLERLSTDDVDLALQLYRDTELLRAVLGAARLPESAARVAISLDDALDGPFLVVTRDGHFVTCLGRGMKTSDLFIVPRSQLDTLSSKFATLRERIALAKRLAGTRERPCAHLVRRLLVRADSVSREEWLAVSAWEPLLQPVFLDMYLGMGTEILQQGYLLRRLRHYKGRAEEALHTYWNLVHAAGHLLLLATMGGDREQFQLRTEDVPAARSALSFALTSTGMIPFITKGAWAVGRLGKQLLSAYKSALPTDVGLFDLLDTMFALVAVGRRAAGLRAEITKALRAAPRSAHTPHAARLREALGSEIATLCEAAVAFLGADDAELEQGLLQRGLQLLGVTEPSQAEELPSDIVRTLPLLTYTDGLTAGKNVLYSLTLIAATARGAPEQFYLPHEVAEQWYRPWEPAFTLHLLEPMRKAEKAQRQPAARKPVPGPNQPCSCGSGRKYKKCCGGPSRPAQPLAGLGPFSARPSDRLGSATDIEG